MKRIIDKLFVLVGTIVFLIYAAPLVALILNAGNIFGMGVGIVLILIGMLFDKIIRLNKKLILIITAFLLVCATVFFSTWGVIYSQTKKPAEQNQTLVVLGCKVDGERPSLQLYNRALAGVEYLKENPDSKAILCGGTGNGENISEAECIKRIMIDNGIDEDRLILEDQSTSTEENIVFAKAIMADNDMDYNIVISTSDYHCYRAKIIAKKQGLNATTVASYANKYSLPTFYTREVFGVWVQWLKAI